MSIARDDARLTAYALNEMTAEERAAFEQELQTDPAAQREVAALQALGGELRVALQATTDEALSPEQRSRVQTGPVAAVIPLRPWYRRPWAWSGGVATVAAAAMAVFMVWRVGPVSPPDGNLPVVVAPEQDMAPTTTAQLPSVASPKGEERREPLAPPAPVSEAAVSLMGAKVAGGVGLGMADKKARAMRDVDDEFAPAYQQVRPPFNTEAYRHITENPFLSVAQAPLSTFSIDVDTASYANVRRFLMADGALPPVDAVRIEELVNYFPYAYAPPTDGQPFAAHVEVGSAPWQPSHRLVRVALKGREIPAKARPASNLVFLIDVSGSMEEPNKLPLLQRALSLLVAQGQPNDRIAIAVYAGASGLVLPSTALTDKAKIVQALEQLQAGGSTNGGAGIQLAYQTARTHFIAGGINRVILATDGDFNVGVTNEGDLVRLVEREAKGGVFLSVLGFGTGNYKDSTLEQLADKGNGNYAYIDTLSEARKVLVRELSGTLQTIAKDVKIQIEFNPARVQAYRLIGYENRLLRDEDFNDDTKDAGEIGAGHTVTALYDVVPTGVPFTTPGVDPLKYQRPMSTPDATVASPELLTLKLRYKAPEGETSQLMTVPVTDDGKAFTERSTDFRFAAAVAGFGMLLRKSAHVGSWNFNDVYALAGANRGADPDGYRQEFLQLVQRAKTLAQ